MTPGNSFVQGLTDRSHGPNNNNNNNNKDLYSAKSVKSKARFTIKKYIKAIK